MSRLNSVEGRNLFLAAMDRQYDVAGQLSVLQGVRVRSVAPICR